MNLESVLLLALRRWWLWMVSMLDWGLGVQMRKGLGLRGGKVRRFVLCGLFDCFKEGSRVVVELRVFVYEESIKIVEGNQ